MSQLTTLPSRDVLQYIVSHFADIPTLGSMAQTCKELNDCFGKDCQNFYKELFVLKGIPFVRAESGPRDYKKDFQVLYPMMGVTSCDIERIFGRIVGEMPFICEEDFNQLSQPDPYEPDKLQSETFHIMVMPAKIETFRNSPVNLSKNPSYLMQIDLENVSGNPLHIVPFTLRNCINLSFSAEDEDIRVAPLPLVPQIIQKFNTYEDRNRVRLVRKTIPEAVKGQCAATRREVIENGGFEEIDLKTLLVYSTVILKKTRINPYEGFRIRTSDKDQNQPLVFEVNGGEYKLAGKLFDINIYVGFGDQETEQGIGTFASLFNSFATLPSRSLDVHTPAHTVSSIQMDCSDIEMD